MFNWIVSDTLASVELFNCVVRMSLVSFKNVIKKNVFTNPIYLIYMYKEDLALNSQQWLICHKSKAKQSKPKHWSIHCCSTHCDSMHCFVHFLFYTIEDKSETKRVWRMWRHHRRNSSALTEGDIFFDIINVCLTPLVIVLL